MGIIKVETPQGVVQVEIEGEQPTQDELDSIDSQFFSTTPSKPSIDLSTASKQEIIDYQRSLVSQGIDPTTGKKFTDEDEFIRKYKEPGVDYSSGLDRDWETKLL